MQFHLDELSTQLKFELRKNILENKYLSGPKGRDGVEIKKALLRGPYSLNFN